MTPLQLDWVQTVNELGGVVLSQLPINHAAPGAFLVAVQWTRVLRTTEHVLLPDGTTL